MPGPTAPTYYGDFLDRLVQFVGWGDLIDAWAPENKFFARYIDRAVRDGHLEKTSERIYRLTPTGRRWSEHSHADIARRAALEGRLASRSVA